MIYFDSAATTVLKPERVYRAMVYAARRYGNPGRSGHKYASDAQDTLFLCRSRIAKLFNVRDPENIVFTMNATHALNIAIASTVSSGDRLLVSGFEHNAVMRSLTHLGADIAVFGDRLFDREYTLESLKREIGKGAGAVIVSHVSNVFGFVQPIEEIAEICREYGVPLIIDASQSAGIFNINAEKLGCAFIAMPGHKSLMGPQGTGVLICAHETRPLLYGGTGSVSESMDMPDFLPDKLEAGTLNMPGIAGLSEGVDFILKTGTEKILAHELMLKRLLKRQIGDLPYIDSYFADDGLQSGVVSMNMRGLDCETFAGFLAEEGIAVRAGLHCAPLAHKSAGTIDKGTVRVSFSYFNKPSEVSYFADAVRRIHARKKRNTR